MGYRFAADLVLLVHLGFVVLVMVGGLAWLRWRWAPWLHLPMAAWGVLVELRGWPCPLTTLENRLLEAAGGAGYETSFVGHYLLGLLYPDGLTRGVQVVLAALVVGVNVVIYLQVWRRRRQRNAQARTSRR